MGSEGSLIIGKYDAGLIENENI